jgi:hypothetical protein
MRIIHLITTVLLFSITKVFAQSITTGSWNILNVKYNMNENWSAFGESQLRSLKLYNNFHYYEYKGGINYKFHKNTMASLGAGSYQTYKEGGDFVLPKNNDEFRIWPQVILFQSIGQLKIEHRYRAEFRFTNNGFRNRFRYRLGVSYPFGKANNEYKPFQINISNELFFTDYQPYFERNRLSFSINYKPSKTTTIQIGYIHQIDYKINDETGRNFLQLGYFIELFGKKNSNRSIQNELKDD